jgi:hypothetical protein
MAEENPGAHPAEHPQEATVEGNLTAAASHVQAGAQQMAAETGLDREGPSLATAALVGVGVAILEPEFIPGMLIGAGALLAPKILPGLGSLLRPMVKGVVKAGYAASMTVREAFAEAGENMQDMVAEARAEYDAVNAPAAVSTGNGSTAEPEARRPRPNKRNQGPPTGGSPKNQ